MLTQARRAPQPADRARELERVYQSRRGHAPQISISDDSHHVTEAIGDLYGDDDDYIRKRDSRPLSFISSPLGEHIDSSPFDPFPPAPPRSPLRAAMTHDRSPPPITTASPNGSLALPSRQSSFGRTSPSTSSASPVSPPPLTRTNSDTASTQFPLNDIDYESSPAGLAQELSNLQAIRRMSMDVNTADPDLPSFKSFSVSAAPPQHFSEEEEQDPSKLFWVPARLHPELAPVEFKTFIEDKVEKIRRRSGDADSLSPDGGASRSGSSGGLRRKKSMLSRQVDGPNGYRDGAERLERKRSIAQPANGLGNLQELEHIVEDPVALIRRMSIDSVPKHTDGEGAADDDMPILPGKPAGLGTLKRSTRTNYRRGSVRKGERAGFPRRPLGIGIRQAETDTEESPVSPTHSKDHDFFNVGLTRVQSEPVHSPENFSRPTRKRSPPIAVRPGSAGEGTRDDSKDSAATTTEEKRTSTPRKFHSRIASNGRTTAPLPGYIPPQTVPQIIETPPPREPQREPQRPAQMQLPERHSSRGPPPAAQQPPPPPPPNSRTQPTAQQQRPPLIKQSTNRHASPIKPSQTFDDLISHPTPLPGNSTRTDNLSIIPNLVEEKKSDKKSKDKGSDGGSRKTSWGWLVGGDKEKEKKEKDERDKELAKKVKNKLSKSEKNQSIDNTRLDVLQSSIDGGGTRGRESVVLDRESVKLDEARKESSKKSGSGAETPKKEKDPGLFSSLFGGKKKSEKESSSSHKKNANSLRGLSPEPPPRILKPDVDYNWTRFSILEERAIYRMAHIKLANPRRELYSQVLLSNFMYSYLAKVQQMHPQIQIGSSPQAKQQQRQQKKEEEERKRKDAQPEEFQQYQRYQQQQQEHSDTNGNNQQQQSDQHGNSNSNSNSNSNAEQHDDDPKRPDSRQGQHQVQSQQQQQSQPRDSHHSNYRDSNGSYKVASGQNYLGHSGGAKGQQQYYGYDDLDQSSRDEDMW
ncbi:hypothetical protein P154DRAFT_546414 [Amniculicola lignicola CBS 123094]|uniref:Protein Zds1 C-terminal domain-containing protein n=1 Tax=Amniculicola lignicola CBS 123094 TaxID=1392246 RepID=A0A6A5WJE7_9PLEO|nr:hypothetical protein P154DRAFT_546414 [Amniculicola lignicola CBS 123094]